MTIIRPIITEKTLTLASRGWYTFMVDHLARKEEIARDVASLYGVNVIGVRTISMHGKMRRVGRRSVSVQKPDWKKALVQLKEGQHIDAFEVTKENPIEEQKVEIAKAEKNV